MKGLKAFLSNIEEVLGTILTIIMSLAVTIGIIGRLLQIQCSWTSEVATYSFMWAVFLGASVATKRGSHIVIDVFLNLFPLKMRKALHYVANIVSLALVGALIYYGFALVQTFWYTKMAILGISIGWAYLSLPVSCCFMFYRLVQDTVLCLRGKKEAAA